MPASLGSPVQDHVALAEIELCGELIIAASAAKEERLSADRIDEVLKVVSVRRRDPAIDLAPDSPDYGPGA